MNLKRVLQALGFVIACEALGAIGSLFTIPSIPTWYAALEKPFLNPPNWIFGPVWTTLFALMGVAAFLVWRKGWGKKPVRIALSLFGVQLLLNVLWSILFFGWHSPSIAFIDIALLWIAILWTIILFWRISRPAAYLFVPYLAWVTFASYLNLMIWSLN